MATSDDGSQLLLQSDDDVNDVTDQDLRDGNGNYGSVSESQGAEGPASTSSIPASIVLLTALSAIGGFLFGYDTGVISGAMLALKEVFHLNNVWQELVVSITIAAAAVFAIAAGPLNDFIGRRMVILLASLIFTAGALLMGLANSKELLLIGRLVVGLGIGLASMTVPVYISESAPAGLRGKLTVINNAFITGGQLCASILDGLLFSDHKNGWRYMLGLAGVPSLVQFIGFLFMPESPRWLVTKGREEKAREVLRRLRSVNDDVDSEVESIRIGHERAQRASMRRARFYQTGPSSDDQWELIENDGMPDEIIDVLGPAEVDSKLVIVQILRHKPTRRALILGCGLQIFQQVAGINTVMYYSATIVQMSGVRQPQLAVWVAAAIAAVNFLFTLVGLLLVDRIGRRRLTLVSLLGVVFSLMLLAVAFQLTAYTAPPISVHLPPPPNASFSSCYQTTKCNSCVNRQDCGFCFSPPPPSSSLLAVNGSCLPTRVGFGDDSLYGPCDAAALNGTDYRWAYNYCPSPYAWVAILGMVLYLVSFAPGMGPMPWTVNSEIFPTWARSTGVAVSTGCNWIFNLIIAITFLTLTENLTRYGTFWLYSGIAFIGFLFLTITLPETKGKTLEEIEKLFENPWTCLCCKL